MQQYAHTKNGFSYPVVPSFSENGSQPSDEKALNSVCPSMHMFNVGYDPKGNAIQSCLVGVGSVKLHNLYRYSADNDFWRLVGLISYE